MRVSFEDIVEAASERLSVTSLSAELTRKAAQSCAWLEACGYPGLKTVLEAAREPVPTFKPSREGELVNLNNFSCVYIGKSVMALASATQRLNLTHVKHGLYLLPLAVEQELAIGCPIDLNFWLGGARAENPYAEKLALARAQGILVADFIWQRFAKVA